MPAMQGGFASLERADGSGFNNTGECVSYAAHGGALYAPTLAATSSVSANGPRSVSQFFTSRGQGSSPFHLWNAEGGRIFRRADRGPPSTDANGDFTVSWRGRLAPPVTLWRRGRTPIRWVCATAAEVVNGC
jgi:hypothetical protein